MIGAPPPGRNSPKQKQNEGLSRPKSQNKFAKSLPTAKQKMNLVVKGVPAEVTNTVTEQEFKEFLDLNKINNAKAERLTSEKDG